MSKVLEYLGACSCCSQSLVTVKRQLQVNKVVSEEIKSHFTHQQRPVQFIGEENFLTLTNEV